MICTIHAISSILGFGLSSACMSPSIAFAIHLRTPWALFQQQKSVWKTTVSTSEHNYLALSVHGYVVALYPGLPSQLFF